MDLVVDTTESGDRYKATPEDWQKYRDALEAGDWDTIMDFETGGGSFEYAPL